MEQFNCSECGTKIESKGLCYSCRSNPISSTSHEIKSKSDLVAYLMEETVNLHKKCNELMSKLEASYTREQEELMNEMDSALDSIKNDKIKLVRLGKSFGEQSKTKSKEQRKEDNYNTRHSERMQKIREIYPNVGKKW